MKNRGDRLYRKALIRKRLIEKAVRDYNQGMGIQRDGTFVEPIQRWEELPKTGYDRIGNVLRNEGRSRERIYRCHSWFCEWCIGSLTYNTRHKEAAINADFAAWRSGEHTHDVPDTLWESRKRLYIAAAESLDLLSRLAE